MSSQPIAGRYQISAHMRRVGETDYYAAADLTTQQAVTLRTINITEQGAVGIGLEHLAADKLKRKMENEAKFLDKLTHPGLLRLLAWGFDEPMYYHVYPAMVFHSLQDEIKKQQHIPYRAVLNYARQAADTLAALHQLGIIHCDISADTLLLVDDQIRIIEFTIANHDVHEGVAPGSPPYMSPEAITGSSPAVSRDVWALGVTLYYALTGKLPFGDIETPREQSVPLLFRKILHDVPEPIANVPAEFEHLILRMLEKAPDQRISDMAEVRSAIEALRSER